MSKGKKWESATLNNNTYIMYYDRLKETAISSFNWVGLPPTIDERFLELTLFEQGMAVFFRDEDLGYLSLKCLINGPLNVYRIPIGRRAYAENGYQKELTPKDSVIIFNNVLHTNSIMPTQLFAARLMEIDRTKDVNIKAQKTPVLIQSTESQRLTMKNLYMQFDGNEPFIFGDKSLDVTGLKAIDTKAPFVADKLQELKNATWAEALSSFGISSHNTTKKERIVTGEIEMEKGGIEAVKFSRLLERQAACKKINEMFGLNVSVEYREDARKMEQFEEELALVAEYEEDEEAKGDSDE